MTNLRQIRWSSGSRSALGCWHWSALFWVADLACSLLFFINKICSGLLLVWSLVCYGLLASVMGRIYSDMESDMESAAGMVFGEYNCFMLSSGLVSYQLWLLLAFARCLFIDNCQCFCLIFINKIPLWLFQKRYVWTLFFPSLKRVSCAMPNKSQKIWGIKFEKV